MKSKQKITLGLLVVVMSIASYAYVNYNFYHKDIANSMVEEINLNEKDELPQDADMHLTCAKFTLIKFAEVVRQIL